MFVKLPEHTSDEVDVDALTAGLKSGEIKFEDISKLADEDKLSGQDYGRLIMLDQSLHPPIHPPWDTSDCIRRSLEYSSKNERTEPEKLP